MSPSTGKSVAVVGATGAVGIEVLKVMESRNFPARSVTLLASKRSAGKVMKFRDDSLEVAELSARAFSDIDIAIFSAGSSVSREYAPLAKAVGCVVVDNSSAFRGDDDVPLVIPEINAAEIKKNKGIIANPNCTTAITLMALWPLHKEFGVERVIASSYQAVSGAGAQGIVQLKRELESGVPPERYQKLQIKEPSLFGHSIAFNVIPRIGSFQLSGYTDEEEKLRKEGAKIMGLPGFRASVTCVRVPVYRAHSIAVSAEFERPITAESARAMLEKAPGLQVYDDLQEALYPMPIYASGKYDCFVGRIRKDTAFDNGVSLFVSGDQLLKGAALNAVQIAEYLVK